MRKLLPSLLILVGLGSGLGLGVFLRPLPTEAVAGDAASEQISETRSLKSSEPLPEFAKLSNQFVVPVVEKNRITSLVILSLSIEVVAGGTEHVYAQEPKLRDGILQLLFDHANTGGFQGSFTDADNLVILRRGLTEVARAVLGEIAKNVLITDIIRQDS